MAAKVSQLKWKLKFCKVCRVSRFGASVLKINLAVGKVGRGGNKILFPSLICRNLLPIEMLGEL